MGLETKCQVDFGTQSSRGKALLETAEVIFRGDFRLKIPFQSVTSLEAADGMLRIGFAGAVAVFHLGDSAEKWADKIRNPPGRLDKLGVKPGMKVQLIGRVDADFRKELEGRQAVIVKSKPDLAFLAVQTKEELIELAYLSSSPVWVVYPKGQKSLTENDVITAGRAAGFVDTKVCSFSQTHTALRFKPRGR